MNAIDLVVCLLLLLALWHGWKQGFIVQVCSLAGILAGIWLASRYGAVVGGWLRLDEQKADYVAGKAVKLENVTDKQGFHATMYIKFNPEKGRPYRYDTNPDNAQQVAPSNESRTQVAVNNDGKTNEATKNLREPLQKGQTNPKDARQQQQQEKPQKKTGKGMKM